MDHMLSLVKFSRREIASTNVFRGGGRVFSSSSPVESTEISVEGLGVHLVSTISVVRLDVENEPTGFLMRKSGISWYTQG